MTLGVFDLDGAEDWFKFPIEPDLDYSRGGR
jgi:hypothetical protein